LKNRQYLSKSDFLKYQTCSSYLWAWKNNREIVPDDMTEDVERRIEQGIEVEDYARKLFPDAVLVEDRLDAAKKKTEELTGKGTETIFQATVITDSGLLAMADVLQRNGDKWDIFEVKSTTEIKKEHIIDSAFQLVAFEEAGYKIGAVNIIYLNKEYRRHGKVDPEGLFVTEEVTDRLREIKPDIEAMTHDAAEYISREEEPKTCSCRYKTKSHHCPTFKYYNPDIPEYSIYNLTRISEKKVNSLVDMEVFHLHDIPDDFELTEKQQNQVTAYKVKQALIDKGLIGEEMSKLVFPLYFLDYETCSTAVPIFDGTWPYQQVCFQYSLHVQHEPGGEVTHFEYLAQKKDGHPIPGLLAQMKADIGPTGSVIVWNKGFEMGRNKEMAKDYPEYKSFLLGVNDRVYDLMEVFSKQMHVHPDFHGSVSIKYVLPVLAPDLSYKNLEGIQNGGIATLRWFESVAKPMSDENREQIYANLLKYCELDTFAMYRIYDYLVSII
jgi:CRISPR/Cas system-associated exonuclease Cas4 (RecB family)